jgi:capsule polysaccharide export protein KpsE/RkpR
MNGNTSNNLWLLLEVLARRRTLIVSLVLVATLAAVGVSLVLPQWYEANALLLPPKDTTIPIGGLSQLAEVVSVVEGLNLPLMVTPSDLYARMLRSRTVAEHIIDMFDLKSRYQTQNMTETYLALTLHSRFEVTEEGLLSISVEDRDPSVAADITNAFVAELDQLNRRISSGRAHRNRQFIEERVNQVKTQLDSARSEFVEFQMTHKAVDFDEQTRLAVEQAISLKVSLSTLDIDLRMKEHILGPDNPELVEKRRHRDVIKQELEILEKGNGDSSFFSLPIAAVPGLKGQYEVLYSRVGVNERLYAILLEQLEQAKLAENENLPTVSVLDYATPPEVRSRPQRSLIVLATFLITLMAALLLAAVLEYFRRMREGNPEDYDRAMYVVRAFLGWLPGVRSGKPAS